MGKPVEEPGVFSRYWTGERGRGPVPFWFRALTLAAVVVGAIVSATIGLSLLQAAIVVVASVVVGQLIGLRWLALKRQRDSAGRG